MGSAVELCSSKQIGSATSGGRRRRTEEEAEAVVDEACSRGRLLAPGGATDNVEEYRAIGEDDRGEAQTELELRAPLTMADPRGVDGDCGGRRGEWG